MSLSKRIETYDELAKKFNANRVDPLISTSTIEPILYGELRKSIATYISRSFSDSETVLDEYELIDKIEKNQDNILNITPNGMVVPKRENMFEYNIVVRNFIRIMDSLNIGERVTSWHIPLNIRVKFGQVNEFNLTRHHPTEHIHSDSWAGESSESVTVHIPVFGDFDNNYMQFYQAPDDFKEEWLQPLDSYQAGHEIAQNYKKIDFKAKKGDVVLADFATLHSSSRLDNSKTRISIDTTFHLKRDRSEETIHPWRAHERASHEVMQKLTEDYLFYFADSMDQQVDSEGGFKHPTNLKLISLKDVH